MNSSGPCLPVAAQIPHELLCKVKLNISLSDANSGFWVNLGLSPAFPSDLTSLCGPHVLPGSRFHPGAALASAVLVGATHLAFLHLSAIQPLKVNQNKPFKSWSWRAILKWLSLLVLLAATQAAICGLWARPACLLFCVTYELKIVFAFLSD